MRVAVNLLAGLLFSLGAALTLAADAVAEATTQRSSLPPLLANSSGQTIGTVRGWRKQRLDLRERWQRFLGPFPDTKPPLCTRVLEIENFPDFKRKRVCYQVEEGVLTDGYLLTPRRPQGKLPAVVVFHPTTPVQARGVAGLEPTYPEEKWQGLQLVRRGYIVWCPRNYINTAGADWTGNAQKVLARHPEWTGMTRMTWDAIRAADYLCSLEHVDPARIGCLGHSLGAKQALFAIAFDPRYKAAVFSEGGIGLTFSNWDALWYLGKGINQPGFDLENHQLIALAAPRAFLLIAGDSSDSDASQEFVAAARSVYHLLGAGGNLEFLNHRGGHNYSAMARRAAEEFLDKHLKSRSDRGAP